MPIDANALRATIGQAQNKLNRALDLVEAGGVAKVRPPTLGEETTYDADMDATLQAQLYSDAQALLDEVAADITNASTSVSTAIGGIGIVKP